MGFIDLLRYSRFKIDESHREQVRQLAVKNKTLHDVLINRHRNLL